MDQVSAVPSNAVQRQFNEKAYRRHTLVEWDRRWYRLSSLARYCFLHHVRLPSGRSTFKSLVTTLSPRFFARNVVDELTAGGFVEFQTGTNQVEAAKSAIRDGLGDFAARAYALRRYHLLAENEPSSFTRYVDDVYYVDRLADALSSVLGEAGEPCHLGGGSLLDRYVLDHRWPSWVAAALHDPLAGQIIDVVRNSDGPVPMSELPDRIAGSDPNQVRAVMDKLIARLALVEDLRPAKWELIVGFLPAVRANMIIATLPRERPPLVVCARPREVGPEGSPVVNDMRAVLLEVASQPPRLRQDLSLFHKEIERFEAALDPLAEWLLGAIGWAADGRLDRAISWARVLELAKVAPEGKQIRLHLTPAGQSWLSDGAHEESLEILALLRAADGASELHWPRLGLALTDTDLWGASAIADVIFLGTHVLAVKVTPGKPLPRYALAKADDYLAVRKHLDLALSRLEPGVFYRQDSVESHLVYAEHNPLNLGRPAEQVGLYFLTRPVPPARPQREEIARQVIRTFVFRRLVPFGCFRAAIDDEGQICVARGPRFDAYFGREVSQTSPGPNPQVAPRVVIQPDFSVVIIGTNPAPVAALAPFCERTTRGGGQGAIVLKLTRESVVKAVKHGLTSHEIVARLEREASNELPANVQRQVEEWSTWVRKVTLSSLIALRCPDSDTADRVMAVMKRHAERVNSTVVAIDRDKLTTTERNKLEDQGILVEEKPAARATGPKSRRK